MQSSNEHAQRIKDELAAVGAKPHNTIRFAVNYLPTIIHENEHIEAAMFGRYKPATADIGISSGMLVATDRRIIFLDHKPGFTTMDEITYDVVSGVKAALAGLFSTVTLHTRVGDYVIRYANTRGVDNFVHYIEDRRLEQDTSSANVPSYSTKPPLIDEHALNFMRKNDTAILSTVDRTGTVHGATIHYVMSRDNIIYILTHASTQKARDIFSHQQVALTVYDREALQTTQLQGMAQVESDSARHQEALTILSQPKVYGHQLQQPPVVSSNKDNSYMVIAITPVSAKFSDFSTPAH